MWAENLDFIMKFNVHANIAVSSLIWVIIWFLGAEDQMLCADHVDTTCYIRSVHMHYI